MGRLTAHPVYGPNLSRIAVDRAVSRPSRARSVGMLRADGAADRRPDPPLARTQPLSGHAPPDRRRLVILTEGQFGIHDAKTALGVIRYGPDEVLGIIDSTMAGRNLDEFLPAFHVPFLATLDEALTGAVRPDALLIGIAPTGGRLPATYRPIILAAIAAGLDIL